PRVAADQAYPVSVLARPMASAVVPGFTAVSVTVEVPVVLAVTPVEAEEQALIPAARFVAKPDVVESTKKFAALLGVVHELVLPRVPAVTIPLLAHVKVLSVAPTVKVVEVPSSVSATVTVGLVPATFEAVTPVVAGVQALIAATRFVARVVVLLLVAYLPVALPVQVLAPPLLPPVTPGA